MNLVSEEIENYCTTHSTNEHSILQQLQRETFAKVLMPQMLSGHLQGAFLNHFVKSIQAQCILEIGTYTGYSALCMAMALPANGRLITIDINEELETLCRRYFEMAGQAQKIDYRLGDASELLPSLYEKFDLVFIDADKKNYSLYYDMVIDKTKTGGYILADNVLWSGKVLSENPDKDTAALQAYNHKLKNDPRVEVFILPLRDGISIARKIA